MTEKKKKKQVCFFISPIGSEGSDVRKRADQVLRHIIKPSASACDFDAIRADEISEPGLITSQVIQHIVDDPLVIADLTGKNPNVFYELALRHAIRKPLVQIIQKDEKIPFDVAGMRTIHVDHRDLDSVDEAKLEIEKQIKSIIKKKPEDIESPVSVSIELQALRHSENPEERSLAEFFSAISDLRSDIGNIEKRLSSPENILPEQYIRMLFESSSRSKYREREIEMMLMETMHRLEKLSSEKGSTKAAQKNIPLELNRIREMLMMMRHEYMRG